MRRWNGWGDDGNHHDVNEGARAFLEARLGTASPPKDATMAAAIAGLPASRLQAAPGIDTGGEARLRHGVGQSFPDWVAIRTGRLPAILDGVAFPTTTDEVRGFLAHARDVGAVVLPWGGGTSVAGHLSVAGVDRPVLGLSMERMTALLDLDAAGCLATFQAGVVGPDLEAALNARGFTLGHYPQSFELSTLGGWVATRSAGHFSKGYGRIEGLFAGGEVVNARDTLRIAPVPASAAGPDLRQVVLGSEGRLGVITSCTMKVMRQPARQAFSGCFLPNPEAGMACVREIVQSGVDLIMARLSLTEETRTGLALSGHGGFKARVLDGWLGLHGVREDACLMLVGAAGSPRRVRTALAETHALVRKHGGVVIGGIAGNKWFRTRFEFPYLRNSLWERGYGIDTLETALPWAQVPQYIAAVESAIRAEFETESEKIHIFTHLSHVYPHGTSAYTTYLFRLGADPEALLERWGRAKAAACETIGRFGGTISHQHGVGRDHRAWLPAEKGPVGMSLLRSAVRAVDPEGLFDTGNLLHGDGEEVGT
jgi:alkyldihydroxyacetonephosphate synthase